MPTTALTIGIPTLAVLVGILLNRNDANRLDARITALGTELRQEIAALRIDLRQEIAALGTELRQEIAAVRQQSHEDIMVLVGISREHESRLTRLESRA
jgi:flagellar biosynthesis regulator FlaF